MWSSWGKEADEDVVSLAADLLLRESDPLRLLRLLSFFDERRYPGDPVLLLAHAGSADDKIARAARHALKNVEDPYVRKFTIEQLRIPYTAGDAIDILSGNYEDGDYKLVLAALSQEMDRDYYHWLAIGTRDFCKAHPSPAVQDVLMVLYENLYCTMCRASAVEMLTEFGPLPEWMAEECRYDASLDLRRLVGA